MALADVELLRLGAGTEGGGEALGDPGDAEAAGPSARATLRVTLRQAVYLTAADNFGREIRLLVRPPGDRGRVAAETSAAFRLVPGLLAFRFFGDFETGTHYYLQVWRDKAALDAYAASESMFRIREIAAPFVTGRPSRRIFVDYTDPIEAAG